MTYSAISEAIITRIADSKNWIASLRTEICGPIALGGVNAANCSCIFNRSLRVFFRPSTSGPTTRYALKSSSVTPATHNPNCPYEGNGALGLGAIQGKASLTSVRFCSLSDEQPLSESVRAKQASGSSSVLSAPNVNRRGRQQQSYRRVFQPLSRSQRSSTFNLLRRA